MTLSGCCVDQHSVQVYSSAKPRIVTCKPTIFLSGNVFVLDTFLKMVYLSHFQPENFNPKSTSYGIQRVLLRCPLGRWCCSLVEKCTVHYIVMGLRTLTSIFSDPDWICDPTEFICWYLLVAGVFTNDRKLKQQSKLLIDLNVIYYPLVKEKNNFCLYSGEIKVSKLWLTDLLIFVFCWWMASLKKNLQKNLPL